MILFLAILCTAVLFVWVVTPLWAPESRSHRFITPQIERLHAVLKALRDLERDPDQESDADRRETRQRLEADRDALCRLIPHDGPFTPQLCDVCDGLVDETEAFCRHCGAELPAPAPSPSTSDPSRAVCPECNRACAGDFAFCPHCGQALKPATGTKD